MGRKITVSNLLPSVVSVGAAGIMVAPGDAVEVAEDDPAVQSAIAAGHLAVRSSSKKQERPAVAPAAATAETPVEEELPSAADASDDEAPGSEPARKTSKPKEGS